MKKKKRRKIKKYKEFIKNKNEEEEFFNGDSQPYFSQNYPSRLRSIKNHSKE